MANPAAHDQDKDAPKAGPSGQTDQTRERVSKFDEEGGDQPQAKSERAVEEELKKALDCPDEEIAHKPSAH